MKMPNVIGSCGFSATGSSVITDYLSEFNSVLTLDKFEFSLPYRCDGIEDLRYHLHEGTVRHNSSWPAIKRFERTCFGNACREYERETKGAFSRLSREYIDNITQVKWIGSAVHAGEDPVRHYVFRIFRKLKLFKYYYAMEKKAGHDVKLYPLQEVRFSSYPDNFEEHTKNYVMGILDAMGRDPKKNLVLDQPFVANNPAMSFPYFENPLAIVVDRDPRDIYLFYKEFLYKKARRQVPVNNVEDFVQYYRQLRIKNDELLNHKNILCVKFEELVYDYENATARVRAFCGVDESEHDKPKKYFDPSKSINNTQLFKRFKGYEKDIAYIEENLKEYLFPFEDYSDRKLEFGKMFSASVKK